MIKSLSRLSWVAALSLAGAVSSCTPLSDPDQDGITFRRHETPNFIFLYTASDEPTIEAFAADMTAKLTRLKAEFDVDTLPVLTVVLYPDRRTFQAANNSSGWVTGLTRGPTHMEIVSPYGPNQVFDLWPDTRAEHMLTHLVTMGVNPNIGNNPRWLWESIALYESGQKTAVNIVPFFFPDAEPELDDLNGGFGTPILDVGYYLGEFMDVTFGPQVIIELLETEGDLQATLGLTDEAFIAQFVAFVRARYSLPTA